MKKRAVSLISVIMVAILTVASSFACNRGGNRVVLVFCCFSGISILPKV